MGTAGRNRPGLFVVPRGRSGRRERRWRLALEAMRRVAERRKFPEEHLRPRPEPLLQVRASNGPGAAATTGQWRRRGAIVRRAAARAVRFRPRGGSRSDGGGKRTPCVCECRGSCTGCQPTFPDGKRLLATLGNLYLQPAMRRRAVLCRCSSAPLPSAAGPLWGHRPVEAASALHHLFCRVSFDIRRHGRAPLLSSLKARRRIP